MYQFKFWPGFGHALAGLPASEQKLSQVVRGFLESTVTFLLLASFTQKRIRWSVSALLAGSIISVLSGCGGVTFNSSSSQKGSGSTSTAATLTMVSCGVQSLTGPQTKTCSVYLSASATSSITVSLTSSNAALRLPASVLISVGEKTAEFNVVTEAVTKSVNVTITAKAEGVSKTNVITLDPVADTAPAPVATLRNISCGKQSLTGPETMACSVSLSQDATSQRVVTLSTGSSALKAPKSINVDSGKSSAGFNVTASAVSTAQEVSLTATMDGMTKSDTIILYPAASTAAAPVATLSKVSCGAQTLTGPITESCAVYLTTASTGRTAVLLASSSIALQMPNSVNVTAGKTTASFNITVSAVSIAQKATLTATAGGVRQTDVITLYPARTAAPTLSKISCGTQSLTGAQTKTCSVTLSAAATSQTSVTLSSSTSALQVPNSVIVAVGQTAASFNVVAAAVKSTQSATLRATSGGVSLADVITLYPEPAVTPTLSGVSCARQTLVGPTTEVCSVYLSAAATSPTVVKLLSSSSAFQVPASVTVASGSASAGFGATVSTVASTVTVTLTAASGGVTQTDSIQLEGASSSAPAVQHEVQLSWNAPVSSSLPVVGYNVYRSTSGASAFQLLNSSVDPDTSYTDKSVQTGQTYEYLVKSVDSAGTESAPSNTTTAAIP